VTSGMGVGDCHSREHSFGQKKKTVVQEEPPPIYLICFPIRKMLQILNVLIS